MRRFLKCLTMRNECLCNAPYVRIILATTTLPPSLLYISTITLFLNDMSLLDLLDSAGLVGLGLVSIEVEKGKTLCQKVQFPHLKDFHVQLIYTGIFFTFFLFSLCSSFLFFSFLLFSSILYPLLLSLPFDPPFHPYFISSFLFILYSSSFHLK